MKKYTSIVLACLINFISIPVGAVPDGYSYQGYLTDPAGSPINGTINITFSLYDDINAINANWSEIQSVEVSQGLFQVKLGLITPFPTDLFGVPLWLGMQLGSDAEMNPRVALGSAPYAYDADTLDGWDSSELDQSAHVSNTENPHNVTSAQIGALGIIELSIHSANPAAHHTQYTDDEAITAMGPRVNSNPLHHDKTTNLSWNNITDIPAGFSDGIDNTSVEGGDITGVAAGTGLFGGGTSGDVTLNVQVPLYLTGSPSGVGTIFGKNTSIVSNSSGIRAEGSNIGVYAQGNVLAGKFIGDVDISGNVGIGTSSTSNYKLHVKGGSNNYIGYFDNDYSDNSAGGSAHGLFARGDSRDTLVRGGYGATFFGYGGSTGGSAYGSRSYAIAEGSSNAIGVYSDATGGATTGNEYAFYGLGKGYFSDNVGIGASPDTNYKLHVKGGSNNYLGYFENINNASGSAHGLFASGDSRGTQTSNGYGATFFGYGGSTSGSAYGSRSYAYANGSSNAYGVYSVAGDPFSTTGKTYAFYGIGGGYFSGKVGIATDNPATQLHINSNADASFANGSGVLLIGSESGRNLIIDYDEIIARNNGAPSKLYLNSEGTHVVVPGLEIRGGADLSEPFNVSEEKSVLPGMVMAIDPENPGKLRIADNSYDRTVAGIVSGANGINPGVSMSQKGNDITEGSTPIALTGRLFALADASYSEIQPGDLLTTSDTLGHVMKVTDHSRAPGSIIGKAMTPLEEGKGYVLVLVSLQ